MDLKMYRDWSCMGISSFCCVLMVGCATPNKDSRSFFLKEPLEITVVDKSTLETIGIENFGSPLRGFCFPAVRLIMVRYSDIKDKDGNYLPDFEALGHEFYHALGEDFHSK